MNSENNKATYAFMAILVTGVILVPLFVFVFPTGWREVTLIVGFSVIILISMAIILRSLIFLPKPRRIAGELLIAPRLHKTIIYILLLMLASSALSLFVTIINIFNNNISLTMISNLLISTTPACFWGVILLKKVEFREHGIRSGASYISWDAIEAYNWIGQDGDILEVKLRKPRFWGKSYSWLIGEKDGEAVNQVMLQKVYYRGNSGEALEGIGL